MALTKTVSKVFPSENKVGLHLELKDDDVVVISKSYMVQFSKDEGVTDAIESEITKRMQADIDKYKMLKARFDNQKYDDARSNVEQSLIL